MGYARVSSKDQNLDRQIEQLKAEKVFTYYTDKASGGSRERPGLDEAMRYVRAGDQLVVTSMDRCARSLTDLYAIVDELVSKGVSVKFLKEGQTYSKDSTPIAKLMLGLLGFVQLGMAVKELDQHREIVEKNNPAGFPAGCRC
ncbi:recombinase family protein [Corynebacterium sp. Q4381]|uniref:recombinase family protein n=1 Tax=Corynebacterium sp. Marseille-Q4381 TaxID=3121597 RepID=UPI002FE5EB65